jgi:ketosteroid isomerase-like protein
MRKIAFYTLFLLFSTPLCAQQSEDQRIEQVIRNESKALDSMSFAEVVKRYWLLDDHTLQIITFKDGFTQTKRVKDLLEVTLAADPGHATVEKTQFESTVSGDVAYSYHHQLVTIHETGEKIYSHETRILRRVNGRWLIHVAIVQQYTPD